MEVNDEQTNKIDQASTNDTPDVQGCVKAENDENNKNTENKSPGDLSESNTPTSSRCSSPATVEENNDATPNDLSKGSRVDSIVNNLVTERINSNCSTTGSENSINSLEKTNGKMNGNCKSSSRRRKLDQPQQCKTTEDELNEMNQMDDKDDLYKDDDLDEEMIEDEDSAYSTSQQIDDLRKLANTDLSNYKALESILQQIQLQQQQQFDSQLKSQLNQQLNNQINQINQLNQINNSNMRSTRVSDRGRLNGQVNSSNNSANSTPVNLSINSPRPMDDDDYLLTNSRNQDFYNESKLDLDQQFNGLSSNLCKEFNVLFDDLQKAISSRKLLVSLQDKLRIRFEQFLNGNDQDLEQFFNSTKDHLTSSIGQLIDTHFQRYKMKVLIQNFGFANNNSNSSINQINHQLNQLNQLNQSSKNLSAISLVNSSKQRKIDSRSTPNDHHHHLRSNDQRPSNNNSLNNSTSLVDQLSSRLQRSSPNLLAGLESKLFQNLNSNLNNHNLNAAGNFGDFKTPFPNFLPDSLPNNLSLVQHLLAQQEELQLQKQLQKENQQDSALSLIAPKRKRIKASDEPRRTRTSNRIQQVTTASSLNLISNSINSLNSISSINTLNSLNPSKATTEMLANIVSRDLNNTPLHNLNHSANTALSIMGTSNNSTNDERGPAVNHQSNTNNNSINSSVFPFNNSSFMNSFNQELDVQQLMMQAAGLNNGQNDNSNRASPISSFSNLSANQTPFGGMLDPSPDNSLNNDLEGAESTVTLSPVHLRKAKLMFFYVRYPSSNVLKTYFRDIKFNKNNTAQLVKWFSNFRLVAFVLKKNLI